jgi:hypothetical protein
MRTLLILLVSLGLFSALHAADVTGRVIKVLPLLLDREGHDAVSPSLFDRDAYQAVLREHTNQVSAVRFDVQWKAGKSSNGSLILRLELRGIGAQGEPKLKTLEARATPHFFESWTSFTLGGDDYKQFGSIVAWRATLWNGDRQIGEQKSFLW